MARKSREDLRLHRERVRTKLKEDDNNADLIQVLVGMGTSGIAAGAPGVKAALIEQCKLHGIENVRLRQVGSLGLDFAEPVIEIRMANMPDTIYGPMTAELVPDIIEKHMLDRELVGRYVQHRPAPDMMED
ncbi:MAG: (2Fe-2S) ferredoxin domain-containing protein [Spirochaetaceae bacterium]|nr:MAG: (2Fe-2S) ferredoxin domain-containing protein [Spirochaetaceae bacterium]